MDREEKILQEYILYVQHKENFVNRTFDTNKFYLILTMIVLCGTVLASLIPFSSGVIFTLVFSLIGMVLSILWAMNIGAYKRLLKIKFQNVIERLEDELPAKPYQLETQALQEAAKGKKGFMYGDVQKILSGVIFLSFAIIFLSELYIIISMLVSIR